MKDSKAKHDDDSFVPSFLWLDACMQTKMLFETRELPHLLARCEMTRVVYTVCRNFLPIFSDQIIEEGPSYYFNTKRSCYQPKPNSKQSSRVSRACCETSTQKEDPVCIEMTEPVLVQIPPLPLRYLNEYAEVASLSPNVTLNMIPQFERGDNSATSSSEGSQLVLLQLSINLCFLTYRLAPPVPASDNERFAD